MKSKTHQIIIDKNRKYWPDLIHFQQMDEIGSYWLGFIYADGYIGKSKNGVPNRLVINLQYRDKSHLLKLADDLKLSHDIIKYRERYGKIYPDITINSNVLASILCSYNIDPRSKWTYKRHVPKLPDYRDYIRGVVDGDGSIIFKFNKCFEDYVNRNMPLFILDVYNITSA